MKSFLALLTFTFAAGATAQYASLSTAPSSSSPPALATTGTAACDSVQGTSFLSFCCLGNYAQTNSQYQCVGEVIPLSATNIAALASSFTAGQAQTSTFSTNGAAMPTNAPGGLVWAGVGGAAVVAAYELI
ncbi:hypothetical protein MMC10_008552 [Thelotrema lepadinum]|nr:hypothetical protein [Thelotrema lepadinum]